MIFTQSLKLLNPKLIAQMFIRNEYPTVSFAIKLVVCCLVIGGQMAWSVKFKIIITIDWP